MKMILGSELKNSGPMLNQTLSLVDCLKLCMYLDDTFRYKPSEKAELFNNYFSGPSNYNTDIYFSNDQIFDIDFNRNRVHKHLSYIYSNRW